MRLPFRVLSATALLIVFPFLIAGCGVTQLGAPSGDQKFTLAITGKLHGGQQAVVGASIQLYAASATANAGASTPLLINPVTTIAGGSFSITNDYVCPATNPLVYIVATGGNPGLTGTVNNQQLAMMALLGTCNNLKANAATTFTYIDELTTVASVQAVASFMTDYAHIGAAPTNPTALSSAFDSASSLVDFSTGQFQGGSGAVDIPEVSMNTLSNVIAACVNTSGGTSGTNTPCGQLLSLTGTTTDTITAALHVTQTPGQNTSALYNLIVSNPPFQPSFTTVPTDFTTSVGFTIPPSVQGGALDSNGHLWLYTGGYSYNTVTDTSTDNPGYITVYDNNFNQLFTIQPGTGGLYFPDSLVADANGHVFAINANNTVSEFASNGSAISPPAGYSTGITPMFSPIAAGDGYSYNQNQAGPITVDALGNVFGATPYVYQSTQCYFELNSAGTLKTQTGNFCANTGITYLEEVATDGLGNAWVMGNSLIAKADASGNLAATAPASTGCFSSSGTTGSATGNIVYDHIHSQLWGYSELGAGAITDAGAAVFCDYGATTLPVSPTVKSTSTTVGSPYSASNRLITNAVLDGAGNLWYVTGGVAQSGTVATSSPRTFNGTITYSSFLNGISPTGAPLTTYNATTNSYGLQPAGLGTNATAAVTNGSTNTIYGVSVSLLGVDNQGNLWAADILTNKVFKISGIATANTINY